MDSDRREWTLAESPDIQHETTDQGPLAGSATAGQLSAFRQNAHSPRAISAGNQRSITVTAGQRTAQPSRLTARCNTPSKLVMRVRFPSSDLMVPGLLSGAFR
jgi:hypothetical protein